jgi:formate dehydrogenase subunit gamma
MMSRSLQALAVLAALLLLPAAPHAQQTIEAETGAGEAPAVFASPGLEVRTPGAVTADTFELFGGEEHLVGRITHPDPKLSVLQQPQGRDWRSFRIQGVYWFATAAILATVVALAAFFLWRGRIRIESGRSGRWVPRFSAAERFAHWATAVAFIVLALTGLIITFGRYLLIPLIGHGAFTPLAEVAKTLHNWSGIPFIVGIILMLVFWIRDNVPTRADWTWLRHGGGMFAKETSFHPETARFNAGQKIIFWSVVLGGLALSVTGFVLMAPLAFAGVNGMQVAHGIHAVMAVLLIAIIIAHIYLGTLGMEGAFDAMGRGEVDENWAREHHRGWYEAEVKGKARTGSDAPTGGKGVPAE